MFHVCFAACFAAGSAPAQQPTHVVQARTLLAADAAHAGSSLKAAIDAQIASGYHINDHHPTLDYLIPTEAKLESNRQISVERIVYPKGAPTKFAFADQPLSVYQGTLLVGVLLKVAPGVPAGDYELKGKLTYQACNESACLPPAAAGLAFTVKVVNRSVTPKRSKTDVFNRIQFD
jgi:hypothetical protein